MTAIRAGLLLTLVAPLGLGAATLRDVVVDRVEGMFVLHSEVWFDASIEQMYGVFLDWDLSTKFSSVIVESRDVEPDEHGRPRYYTLNRTCLFFYCRTFERNGWIEHKPFEYIKATADPAKSDFHVSKERWQFREEGDGTTVVYDLEFKPKFFVPPVIGPYVIKRKLRTAGTAAIDRIEAIAQQWSADAE